MSKIYEKFLQIFSSVGFFWTFFISGVISFLLYNAFNLFSWLKNELSFASLIINFFISWFIYFIFLFIVFQIFYRFHDKKRNIENKLA